MLFESTLIKQLVVLHLAVLVVFLVLWWLFFFELVVMLLVNYGHVSKPYRKIVKRMVDTIDRECGGEKWKDLLNIILQNNLKKREHLVSLTLVLTKKIIFTYFLHWKNFALMMICFTSCHVWSKNSFIMKYNNCSFRENSCVIGSKKWIQIFSKYYLFMDTSGILGQWRHFIWQMEVKGNLNTNIFLSVYLQGTQWLVG